MCGIHSPVGRMVADGGNACADVRWYCRDTWGCTQRWTSRSARPTATRPDVAETEASGEQVASLVAARPTAVMTVLGPGKRRKTPYRSKKLHDCPVSMNLRQNRHTDRSG
jgi:hypothetical protein